MRPGKRLAVFAAFACMVTATARAAGAGSTKPNAADLVRAVRRSEMWMYDFDSLFVRARGRWVVTPAAHAVRRHLIVTMQGVNDPNEKRFPNLRKTYEDTLEYAVDRKRVRYLTDDPGYRRQLKIWDGNELKAHTKYYHREQEYYLLDSKIEEQTFYELFAINYGWPRSQPHSFWWNERDVDAAMDLYGVPESFRTIGRQTYRGIPCHVLECDVPEHRSPGLAWRWFVGQSDRLLYGVETLRYSRVVVEHWTLDYREVVPGGWFPMKTGRSIYQTDDAGRTHLESTRNLEVIELRVNEPLADELFTLTIQPGVRVADERFGRPQIYRVWRSLLGKELPLFEEIDLPTPVPEKGKRILIVFLDVEQRPSRHALQRLITDPATSADPRIELILIQASALRTEALTQWRRKLNVPFEIGTIRGDAEAVRKTWGVRSLPWLILTDTNHVVTAEGFPLDDLDKKLNEATAPKE